MNMLHRAAEFSWVDVLSYVVMDEILWNLEKKEKIALLRSFKWLPHKDSNLNKQIQNLRCYHYTMRQ